MKMANLVWIGKHLNNSETVILENYLSLILPNLEVNSDDADPQPIPGATDFERAVQRANKFLNTKVPGQNYSKKMIQEIFK